MFQARCWWKSRHRSRLQVTDRAAAGPKRLGRGHCRCVQLQVLPCGVWKDLV